MREDLVVSDEHGHTPGVALGRLAEGAFRVGISGAKHGQLGAPGDQVVHVVQYQI